MTVLLFYVLPFIVVNSIIFILVTAAPKGDLTIGEADNFTTTTMELKIKSLFPIKAMTVTLDGNEVELTKTASKTYTAVLGSNGTVKVSLTAFNGMKNVFSEQVNILDDTPPDIKDSIIEDGVLSFRLEDTQSGVNYDTIYAYDDDTPEILPLSNLAVIAVIVLFAYHIWRDHSDLVIKTKCFFRYVADPADFTDRI